MDILIVWDINPGATSYFVRYKLHSSSVWTTLGFITDNYANFIGLVACENYDFEITPYCFGDGPGVPGTAGTPTVISNVFIGDEKCNPNAFFTLKVTNGTQPGNTLNITAVGCDLGSTTTSTMPVTFGISTTQILFLYSWNTINYTVTVNNYSGSTNSVFTVYGYRNSILESSAHVYTVGPSSFMTVPVPFLHPPVVGDIIEIKVTF